MPNPLDKINRFVVLMLENRSFDHLVGYLKTIDHAIDGLTDGEFSNYPDPSTPLGPPVTVASTAPYVMPFDPPHEFKDVQIQLYGTNGATPPEPNARVNPALMNGFLFCGNQAATAKKVPDQGVRVMECFAPTQVPCFMRLAQEFALFNYWYSSLPGPTWPNRFFVHAATSGGLSDSPGTEAIVSGYSFKSDTIYHALANAGKDWRIYHDGLPQTAGIKSLLLSYIDPFTRNFREMKYFQQDVEDGTLPDYTFIEPLYGGFFDTELAIGNSMHPQDDVRAGDQLIRLVYETLRNSTHWQDTVLIITFDEHGGFFDHVAPPAATPTGDDSTYADPANHFNFDLYGVRVPAIAVSAYTQRGTVIGNDRNDPATQFDHTSILATVEAKFGLPPLTERDKKANNLAAALNLDSPRTDALARLP